MKLSPAEFIAVIAPIAVKLKAKGSTIFPSVRIAQAALETGWTIHSWNNLVGFKVGTRSPNAYWKGAYVNKGTWETYDGVRTDIRAHFRAYETIEDGFRDQDNLLKMPRYIRVRSARTTKEQTNALLLSGYATDPRYPQKLNKIISKYDLHKYDKEAEVMKELAEELETIKKQLEQVTKDHAQLQNEVKELKDRASMPIPEWAKAAVAAAVEADIIDTPEDGSYDFYRVLTILYRYGALS